MAAVTLIVTGEMEHKGLARSLNSVFPEVEFTVQWIDGFTSTKVLWPPPTARGVKSAIEKYAAAFIAALFPGRREPRPDWVFGIEDLELENRGQPEAVILAFRSALAAELEIRRRSMNSAAYDKLVDGIKNQCSFHLFAPMPEAYFFADLNVLRVIGCAREAILAPDCDVEHFRTTDPTYLQAPPQTSVPWAIDPNTRPFHPKRYLQFLLDPILYSETEQGVKALLELDWRGVLAKPQHTLFLRSWFQDLAYAVGLDQSVFPGETHASTSDYRKQDRILRNF